MRKFKLNLIIWNIYYHINYYSLIALTSCKSQIEKHKNVFYINNQEDFDKYSGTEFSAGSKVLFAEGIEFKGEFILKGSGTKDSLK